MGTYMTDTNEFSQDIKDYVERGGRDAFAFSIKYRKDYGNIPGNVIQRLIDEEVGELKRKGRR